MITQTIQEIPINKIHPGRNPRKRFDPEKLQELAQSIAERGLKQPIVVEPHKDGYILVMGERRLRAHKLLQRSTIEAYVRAQTNHNGRERFLDAVIENDQRADMTAIERARAYQVLQVEYGLSAREISKKIGKSETVIGYHLLLLDLDPEIQNLIDEGFWHDPRLARGLLQIEDRTTRVELARRLAKHKISLKGCLNAVSEAQRLVGQLARAKKFNPRKGAPALQLADADERPRRWGMLQQLGTLPAWELVVQSAEQTCDVCPLRSMASRATCEDCGAVVMLRKMVEAAK